MKKQLLRQFPVVLGLIILTLGLFLPTSCTKDIFPGAPDDDLVEMVITVGGNTKTANDGDATIWTEGDQLSVIHSAPNATTFWLSPFTYNPFYGAYAFYGTVSKLSANNDWYAVYPYDAKHVSAENISLDFPASQVQTGNGDTAHLAGETMPMVGKTENVARSTDLSIRMQNLLSVAEFNITNTREQEQDASIFIKSVQMTASVPIAGAFIVDLTGEKPLLTADAKATKTVTLTVRPKEEDNPQPLFIPYGETAKFYVAIAPFTAPAGSQFKVKVIAAPSYAPGVELVYYHTITLTSETPFESSSIKPILVSFDETKSENPDGGSAGEVELEEGEQPEDGEYLLVYENGANSMAFAAFDKYKSNKYAIPVTVVNGVVIPQDGEDLSRFAMTIEVAKDSNGNPIEHPNDEGHYAYNVRNADGKYVFYATANGTYSGVDALHILDNNEMQINNQTYQYYHTFEQTSDGVRIVCSINTGGNFYLLSYNATDGFNYQQDNASGTNLHLYRLGGAAKEKQHLSFEPGTVTYDYDAGGDFPEPALSGAQTPVSYTSSNEAVATVATDGTVTIHKAGSATITAKAEASETFYAATASYTILSKTSKTRTFYLTTELTAGEEYVIVSAGQALTNNDGTIGATGISAADGVVLVADDAIVWTAAASGSGFTLSNNGAYVQRGSGSGGAPSITTSPNSSYNVWTYTSNRLAAGSYYLYYSSGWKQTSSSSTAGTLSLYSSTKPLTPQSLAFEKSSVRWTVGEDQDYQVGKSYRGQSVSGAKTTVTYESSNTDVATVSGTTITIHALGSTTITAKAEANEEYKAGSASYTLRIAEPLPGGFVDLGTFNLENDKVSAYLDEAAQKYTDDNYTSTSIVATYSSSASNTNRLDIPKPVTLTWDT
ncbi:MAG: Ig-like domain-containing protein, partial [Bacteroidales bacterium]|nr:Ig-like domain-containing protein [Bacteroidales bacterium]